MVPSQTAMRCIGLGAGAGGGHAEWERDVELSYQLQTHALRRIRVQWLNGTFRSGF